MICTKSCLALFGGFAMSLAAAAAPGPLDGPWGGDRLQLVVDATGARVEMDCASGRIAGPITLSPSGAFAASGSFEQHQGGPQRADGPAAAADARYSGEVKGDFMTLAIQRKGAAAAEVFSLRRGVRVKLVRCL